MVYLRTNNRFLKITIAIVLTLSTFQCYTQNNSTIYHKGWIDFNKNGKKDIYEDSAANIEERIKDLISQMTIDEKTCQLATLYGFGRVLKDELPTHTWNNSIWKDGIGNIDEHLNGLDRPNTKTQYSWPASKHAMALNQVQAFFIEETRLGIPVDFTNEGIRGICHEKCTNFPAQIGIGSTWNKQLVREIGNITAKEGKALGYTNIYAPILDLARDPRWGRTVECYGEDPYLVGELGVQMVKGIQENNVASTCKHFAVYSIPKGGRDGLARTDPQVTYREMHQIYLAPFKKAITEGHAKGVMSSYNDSDGIPVSASSYFLVDLLRNKWGFKGYIVSDSQAVKYIYSKHRIAANKKGAVKAAIKGGLNVRTDFNMPNNYILPLRELVKDEEISEKLIDQRVADVLRVKFEVGLFDHPYSKSDNSINRIIRNKHHEKTSLQASRESMILLKNADSLLPLDLKHIRKILIVGPCADLKKPMISRYGPAKAHVISIAEGIKQYVGNKVEIKVAKGCNIKDEKWPLSELFIPEISQTDQSLIEEATTLAKDADLVIAVLGEDDEMVGESKSRTSLNLPGAQRNLVKALHETGKSLVSVLINGRPLTINTTFKYTDSLFEMWFPGSYGGQVLAEAIFGEYTPGGKLPVTIPKSVGQLPLNFPFKPGSQSGQSWKKDPNGYGFTRNVGALFHFGYGLSYTQFKYENLKIDTSNHSDSISIAFDLHNTGKYNGDEIVQIYARDKVASVIPYDKVLCGFERIKLNAGEKKHVVINVAKSSLLSLDRDMKWRMERGTYTLMVASSSVDIRLEESIELEEWQEENK
ncbi:beta-glucosidase [Puteibacter caeruleilacunae]|nr:beta-glucosidase [Puteibacter caeruleilacunae]